MARVMKGRAVVPGTAKGQALVSGQPLSLWGGLDATTGRIIDQRHDRAGAVVAGRVFVFPQGKGSSTASAVLVESVKAGTAPAAIVNCRLDPILALGAIVAEELYGVTVPVVVLAPEDLDSIRDGDRLLIAPDGTVRSAEE